MKKIPTGKISRSTVVGTTIAKAGIKKVSHIAKSPFLSKEGKKESKEKSDEAIAKMLFGALNKLRGPILKVAQMMANEIEYIPEVFRKELIKATSKMPPFIINRALLRKVFIKELGSPAEKLFSSFEAEPFAAASFGQVHRAELEDGTKLAVKLQYPGLAKAAESDLGLLKNIAKLVSYMSKVIELAVDEIKDRVREEVDYNLEAKNTKWFYENLEMDDVVVPKVYDELSTDVVISTSMLEGVHFDDWLKTDPTQEERNRYGQIFTDLFIRSFFDIKTLHADPNFGNYIFLDNGKLGLIDFGCVKKFDQKFVDSFAMAMKGFSVRDVDTTREAFTMLGITYSDDLDGEELLDWGEWFFKPYRHGKYCFKSNDEYIFEGIQYMFDFTKNMDNYNSDMVFFFRSYLGLGRMLQKLGAEVNTELVFEKFGLN